MTSPLRLTVYSLKEAVSSAEGVVHTAFSITDYSQLTAAFAKERAAVELMLSTATEAAP